MVFISPALDEEDFAQTHCFDKKKNPSNFQSIGGLEHTCMKLHFLNKTYYFLLFELPCSQMIFECFCQKNYYFWKTLECDVFLYPKFDTIVVKLLNWRFSNFANTGGKVPFGFTTRTRRFKLAPWVSNDYVVGFYCHVACKYLHAHSWFLPFRSLYTIAKFPEAMGWQPKSISISVQVLVVVF